MPSFRHFVDVFKKTSSQDDDGQPFVPVAVRKNVPCNVTPTSGREVEQGHQNVPVNEYTVRLFQAAANPITPDCWLSWKGRRLEIANVQPLVSESLPVDLLCTEEVGKA